MASVFCPSYASLYVGDLEPTISESDLLQCFSTVGPVSSVRVCRDCRSSASLCYGYVNFINQSDASKALESLNHTQLKGKPMRIMWSNRDPLPRKSGVGNLFVKNLDLQVDSAVLHKIFGKFGNILSCKVVEQNGKSQGYGFVQFNSEAAAKSAIEALHGSEVYGKKVYVSKFVKRAERQSACGEPMFTNLYVKNLENGLTEDFLKEKFSEFGKVNNAVIMKDDHGKSRGFGFVSFECSEEAKKAVDSMNGAQLGSKNIYVGRAQKKDERKQILSCQFKDLNVYVKNLDDSVDDEKLREHFNSCGKIRSAKVMCDDEGRSRGFGFVCFFNPKDAEDAVNTLNGKIFEGKPLYVAIAQRKEDRRALLRHLYANNIALPQLASSNVVPTIYHPLSHYSLSMSAASQINPYNTILYQDFGMSPSTLLSPKETINQTFPPLGNSSKQTQTRDWVKDCPLLPSPQHAMILPCLQTPLNQVNARQDWKEPIKCSAVKNHQELRSGPCGYQKHRFYKSIGNRPSFPLPPSYQGSESLRKQLLKAAPRKQKQMIGDHLYPLVQEQQYDHARKITGMLLEHNTSELLELLESPEKLTAQIKSAVEVLKLAKSKTSLQDSDCGIANVKNYRPVEVPVN